MQVGWCPVRRSDCSFQQAAAAAYAHPPTHILPHPIPPAPLSPAQPNPPPSCAPPAARTAGGSRRSTWSRSTACTRRAAAYTPGTSAGSGSGAPAGMNGAGRRAHRRGQPCSSPAASCATTEAGGIPTTPLPCMGRPTAAALLRRPNAWGSKPIPCRAGQSVLLLAPISRAHPAHLRDAVDDALFWI